MDNRIPHFHTFQQRIPQWLLSATQAERDELQRLILKAQQSAEALRLAMLPVPPVRAFALEGLQPALDQRFGEGIDPESVRIERTWRPACIPEGSVLDPNQFVYDALREFCPTQTQAQPLLYAALANYPSAGGYGDVDESFQIIGSTQVDAAAFVELVYNLDIGSQYQALVSTHIPKPATPPSSLESHFVTWHRDQRAVEAEEGVLQGHISREIGQRWLNGALRAGRKDVRLFGHTLEGARCYDLGADGVLLYLPNSQKGALHAFANEQAVRDHILDLLRAKEQRASVVRMALLKDQRTLAGKLLSNLGTTSAALPHAGNTTGDYAIIQFNALGGDDVQFNYRQWRESILLNAAVLAVPASALAQRLRDDHIAALVAQSEQVLFTAAMLVPGCQPLGWAALAVFVHGVVDQVYDGYQAWQLGDREAAVRQFFNVGANLAAGAIVSRIQGRLLSGLHVVENQEGEARLWRHETSLWQPISLRRVANRVRAPFREAGYEWVPLNEEEAFVVVGAGQSERALNVPRNHSGAVPILLPAEGQTWQWLHDSPLGREGLSLLHCFADLPPSAQDQDLLEAWQLSGLSSARLRWLLANGRPLPGAVCFWLRDRQLRQELATFFTRLRAGTTVEVQHPELMTELVELPGWPHDLALEYTDADGTLRIGSELQAVRLSLTPLAFSSGQWAEQILGLMPDRDRAILTGSSRRNEQGVLLSRRWAQRLEDTLPMQLTRLSRLGVLDEAGITLLRAFPSLPEEIIQEVVDGADSRQYRSLFQGKVPHELSLVALEASRRMRIGRALDALDRAEPSDDADRLFMANLGRLEHWPATMSVRLDSDSFSGQPLGAVGPNQQPRVEIFRAGSVYRRRIGGGWSDPASLEQLICDTLTPLDRERLTGGAPSLRLRQKVSALAWRDFSRLRSDLGIRPANNSALQLPQRFDDRIGYPLSGRFRVARTFSWRLIRLYPTLNQQAMARFQEQLQAETGLPLAQVIVRLENQWAGLNISLSDWMAEPVPSIIDTPYDRMRSTRSQLCELIRACWRRETRSLGSEDVEPQFSLDLSYHEVGQLPHLGEGFEHVRILRLNSMMLGLEVDDFLQSFPNLRELHLNNNLITQLPPSIAKMKSLRVLNIANTPLVPQPSMFDPLVPEAEGAGSQLHSLTLTDIPAIDAQALMKLSRLDRLNVLHWSNARAMTDQHLSAISSLQHLRTLVLNRSGITLTPGSQGFLRNLSQLQWIDLGNNPLTLAPDVTGMVNLARLILRNAHLSALPAGMVELAQGEPGRLSWIDLGGNRLQHIEPLISALRAVDQAGRVLYIRLNDNPIQGAQIAELESMAVYLRHSADTWLPPSPQLRRAVRLARGNTLNAAFLDWVSVRVNESLQYAGRWAEFLTRIFDVAHGFARFREAIGDFEARLETFRRGLFSQIHNYWKPELRGLMRQLEAFTAAQEITLAPADDRYDALLQHNYRSWQAELAEHSSPEGVARLTQMDRFVTWLLHTQSDLDQNEIEPPLGEQDWRPYLGLIDTRWNLSRTAWEEAQSWLEDALETPQDSGRLPAELVDQMIAPSHDLPRAYTGAGAPADVVEPVSDVVWRVNGAAQPVQLNEDQYRRASQVYRRARVLVQERLAREITEGAVRPWWEPVQE